MKLKLSEDAREWQKAVWWGALGLALLDTLLGWRRVLPRPLAASAAIALGTLALVAWVRPRWFRGYYRFSRRVGFRIGQALGCVLLTAAFFLVLVPLGLLLRGLGKDLLRLKRPASLKSYWSPGRELTPLDRLY